jgi:peptidoglycan/xylan/chitin deacetylase (PgdA/CDA1 family)
MASHLQKRTVLAYHEIMPESDYSYCVPAGKFKEQLQMLTGGDQLGHVAHITFDDGERSQMEIAGPLLHEQGIRATYFVTPGLIGTAHKFLSWEQLAQLKRAGHSVQSHGWSHKFLTACDDCELEHELKTSKQSLEDQLGAPVEEISIPGGRWSARVLRACADAGYRRVYVSEPWIAAEMSGVQVIGRFMVRNTTSTKQLEKIVRGDGATLRKMKLRSQIRKSIVSLVGDDRYHRLWCRLTGYDQFEDARQQSQ